MLGLALVYTNESLFTQIVEKLGPECIAPFSDDFLQCQRNNPKAKILLELTLKACLVAREIGRADVVISFAHNHGYKLISIDEQTVWYMV